MDNCFNSEISSSDAKCSSNDKLRTHFAKIIVGGTTRRPYYEIMYYDPSDHIYHIGYGSYCLDYVVRWLADEFDIIEDVKSISCLQNIEHLKRIIARRVKTRMFDLGINCKELAYATGMHVNTVLRIANGENLARIDNLLAIANALNCSIDWLLDITYL